MTTPRVAFFTDSFHEVNGVALTSRQFEAFARRRQLPFFSVHAAARAQTITEGSVTSYELQRSSAAFNLEATSDLSFDPLLWRNSRSLMSALQAFKPDLLHVTGPGDLGFLGLYVAYQLGVPLAASWHTNVHEYAGRRLHKLLSFLPPGSADKLSHAAERGSFRAAAQFYNRAKMLFAPNQELVDLLRTETKQSCHLMQRGVDAILFNPQKRTPGDRPFTIGYVGRLSVEKNVRLLADLEKAIRSAGITNYRFLLAGSGGEQQWLSKNLQQAEMRGVLRGEVLARAYADMDVFAFPSQTDTFGNVILEALASGVPAVVTAGGGPKYLVRSGETGFVAADDAAFLRCVLTLMRDGELHSRMQLAARAYACDITWDRVFEKVYDVYSAHLSRNGFRAAS